MKTVNVFLVVIIFALEKGLLYFDNHCNYFAHYAHDTLLAVTLSGAILSFVYFFYGIKRKKRLKMDADDELSKVVKYRAGHIAFVLNLIFWLFLFSDRIRFTDLSNLLGGGLLISLFIGLLSLLVSRYYPYAKQD